MEPENIDWKSIESIFIEDDTYEHIDAPKWVDLSAPSEPVNDEAWFCNSGCKHPKKAEDFLNSNRNSKVKLLRSVSISEILPFKERNCRDLKLKGNENNGSSVAAIPKPHSFMTKSTKFSRKYNEDGENHNPNISTPPLAGKPKSNKPKTKPSTEHTNQRQPPQANPLKPDKLPRLKSTFSARNLTAGREILNQITEFCSELKRLATKGSKKGSSWKGSGGVSSQLKKERGREREQFITG